MWIKYEEGVYAHLVNLDKVSDISITDSTITFYSPPIIEADGQDSAIIDMIEFKNRDEASSAFSRIWAKLECVDLGKIDG